MNEFNFQNAFESVLNLLGIFDMQNGITFKEFTEKITRYCKVVHHKSLVIISSSFVPEGMSGYTTWSEQGHYIVTYDESLRKPDQSLLEHVLTHEFVHILLMHVANLPSIETILATYFDRSPGENTSELFTVLQEESFLKNLPDIALACRGLLLGDPEQEKSVEYIASSLRGFIMPGDELVAKEEIYYW